MVLEDSNCLHVVSDGFDSFLGDLNAFRNWPPPGNLHSLVKYDGKFESFRTEFRRIKFIGGEVKTTHQVIFRQQIKWNYM